VTDGHQRRQARTIALVVSLSMRGVTGVTACNACTGANSGAFSGADGNGSVTS
jgi:hypothetical protein